MSTMKMSMMKMDKVLQKNTVERKEEKKMKVKALFTGCDLTEGKIYDVIFEYDTVYELKCDTGIYCRNKKFL